MAGYGERFRVKRKQRGLTLRDAAKQVGITEDGLGKIERDESGASFGTITKMAEAYECEVGELFLPEEQDLGMLRAVMKDLPSAVREEFIRGAERQARALRDAIAKKD